MQSNNACPHCGVELPAVTDAFCPECREELHSEKPLPVKALSRSSAAAQIDRRNLESPAAEETEGAGEQLPEDKTESTAVRRGRFIVNCVLAFSFAMAIVWFALLMVVADRQHQLTKNPLVGITFLIVIGVCIHKGQAWARYVLTLQCGLGAIGAFMLIASLLNYREPILERYFAVYLPVSVIAALGYAACAGALLKSPDVLEFLQRQRPATISQRLEVRCENCGTPSLFRGELEGTTQDCPHCNGYVDVRN